jgi:hypothetical protein
MVAEKISAVQITEAVAAARIAGNGRFSLAGVLKLLPGRKTKALTERVRCELDGDETLFSDAEDQYIIRDEFFRDSFFLITPDELEIDEGILFPGHRFSAFLPAEVFPSEVELCEAGGENIRQRHFAGPLLQVFPYHLLMGSEQVFDFFIAEHEGNRRLAKRAGGTEKVTLRVFDLKAFYRRHDFSTGDALRCRVVDYRRGVFSFEYVSGNERKNAALVKFCADYAAGMAKVIARFDAYLDIPEQLAWGFFYSPAALRTAAGATASLDEFIKNTQALEINYDAGHSVLTLRRGGEEDGGDDGYAVPEGVSVSKGCVDSLEALLKSAGSVLTPTEIDAYILESCHYRELDFETFFGRCFGSEELDFVDDAQEAIFYNYVEDRWEDLTRNYNRVDDEPKAEARNAILELIDDRSRCLSELRNRGGIDPVGSAGEKLARLAEVSRCLQELLTMLNDPGCFLSEEELEAMNETIAGIAETQNDIIESIESDATEHDKR